MTDTRWEEAKQDLYSGDVEYDQMVDPILDRLKKKGWKLVYPDDWPDLCSNCKSHIEEGTWHSAFNGNHWGACEVHQGPPRGMVERGWQIPGEEKVMVPYWGDPKPKSVQ